MTCQDLSGRLALLAGGDLEVDRDAATCAEHLRGCAACRGEMTGHRRARTLTTRWIEPDIDVRTLDELHARVLAVVGERQRSKRRAGWMPTVGFAAMAAAAAWVVLANAPSPARPLPLVSAVRPEAILEDVVLDRGTRNDGRPDADHEVFRAERLARAPRPGLVPGAIEVATGSPGVRVVWLGEIPGARAPDGSERL